MDRWVGKICVVTGASSGIGAVAAKTLAEKGLIVVGLARRIEKIEALAAVTNGVLHAIKCDVGKESDILNAFRWIESSLGGVDVLINNAGIGSVASLSSGSTADFKNVLNINVLGLCICTKEALKSMRKRGDDGQIIHINSIAGHNVPQYAHVTFGTYPASKFAVTALTESLRVELQWMKSNIKVTSISPGAVYTELSVKLLDALNMEMTESLRDGMLRDQDIVESILYILSTRPGVQVQDIIIQPILKSTSKISFD